MPCLHAAVGAPLPVQPFWSAVHAKYSVLCCRRLRLTVEGRWASADESVLDFVEFIEGITAMACFSQVRSLSLVHNAVFAWSTASGTLLTGQAIAAGTQAFRGAPSLSLALSLSLSLALSLSSSLYLTT
jgi:hypothetical protein